MNTLASQNMASVELYHKAWISTVSAMDHVLVFLPYLFP
jgi:hypothetical protein